MLRATLFLLTFIAFVLEAGQASAPFVTFSDPVMNFTFSYPDEFRSLASVQPLLGGCLTIPLRLAGKSERPYERILINEIDYGCLERSTPDVGSLTRSTSNDLLNVYGKVVISEPIRFLLDGHAAAFISATAEVGDNVKGLEPGMKLYAAQTCVQLGHRVACWNVLSSDQTRLSLLLTSKVSFNGRPGQMWTPSR